MSFCSHRRLILINHKITYEIIVNLNLQKDIVEEKSRGGVAEFPDEASLRLHILLADSLHDGFDLALGVRSTP